MGYKKGHRIKEILVFSGWLEEETVSVGCTRKLLLRPTKATKEALKLDNIPANYGSITHEYWKYVVSNKLKEKGFQVQQEVPRLSGNTDVVARKDIKRIAIEIETGKSNYIRNLKQNLAASYDQIIIVATSKKAFEKIEKELLVQGLLIPPKVQLYLRDEFVKHISSIC